MKHKRTYEILVWVLALLPLAVTLALYGRRPEQVPIHWNMQGRVDEYGPRIQLIWLALVPLGIHLMMLLLPRIDPKKDNYARFGRVYGILRLAMVLFFLLMQGITLYAALAPAPPQAGRLILAAVGLLLCVIGNFMPKFKHNYFCGVKTPWALASAENWRRTHRLAGPLWFWTGLAFAAAGLALPEAVAGAVLLAGILPLIAIPIAYSWWLWHTKQC